MAQAQNAQGGGGSQIPPNSKAPIFVKKTSSTTGTTTASASSSSHGPAVEPWRAYRVTGKINEAKNLVYAKQGDYHTEFYCVGRLDNQVQGQFTSQRVAMSENPFWSEDFKFDSKIGFSDVKFMTWLEFRGPFGLQQVPIGKVVIPRNCFSKTSSEEQWYMLMDASLDAKVTGSIEIQIKHFPPKMPRKVHGFSVNIIKAKDLSDPAGEPPNSYAVLHLLPDPEAITSQHTHIQLKSNEPIYSETFFFTSQANPEAYKKKIHVAIWNQDQSAESLTPTFLGHVTIPLGPIIQKKRVHRWYSLTTLEDDTELLASKPLKQHKKTPTSSALTEDEKKGKTRDFVKALHLPGAGQPLIQRDHKWIDKTFGLTACTYCTTVMMGTHSYCSECHIGVHQKCLENMTPTCGGVGAIRLKLECTKSIVFESSKYESLVDVLKENNYQILNTLGKVSSYREEVAKSMIRILDNFSQDFVISVVKQEIMGHDDPKTLFRANSMASKALDVFMKIEGSEYLKGTLENVLKLILISQKPFELDSTRWEQNNPDAIKNKKKPLVEDSVDANSDNLKELNMIVTDCIFQSVSKMPSSMKQVFAMIQKTVEQKFPGSDMVRYTSVSGFIFLRFFAPAILGPLLFNLKVGVLDTPTSRKLTLIAKTLQNLSNFVEFGQKEPFMEPMNTFIIKRIPDMKKFIDAISIPGEVTSPSKGPKFTSEQVARECADISKILSLSMEKLKGATPPCPLVPQLEEIIMGIEASVKEVEEKDQAAQYDIAYDTGIDIEEEAAAVEAHGQEDKSLLKMLTKVAHNNAIPNGSPLSASSIASYRNSQEISHQLVKGKIEWTNVPVFSFSNKAQIKTDSTPSTPITSSGVPITFTLDSAPTEFASAKTANIRMSLLGGAMMSDEPNGAEEEEKEKEKEEADQFPDDIEETPDAEAAAAAAAIKKSQLDAQTLGTPGAKRRPSMFNQAMNLLPRASKVESDDTDSQQGTPTSKRRPSMFTGLILGGKAAENTESEVEPPAQAGTPKRRPSLFPGFSKTSTTEPTNTSSLPVLEISEDDVKRPSMAEDSKKNSVAAKTDSTTTSPLRRNASLTRHQSESSDALDNKVTSPLKKSLLGRAVSIRRGTNDDSSPTSTSSPNDSSPTIVKAEERRESLSKSLSLLNNVTSPQGTTTPASGSQNELSLPAQDSRERASSNASLKNLFSGVTRSRSQRKNTNQSPLGAAAISPICPKCSKQPEVDDCVIIGNKRYHRDCLVCGMCKEALNGEAYQWKDDIVCADDYFHLSGMLCNICDKPIQNQFITMNGGKKVHPDCRPCSLCKAPLAGKEFAILGNAVFCFEHKDMVPCFACHKKIDGSLVEANNRFYHPNHFLCFQCGKDLNGCINYESDDHPYCQWCFMSIEAPGDVVIEKKVITADKGRKKSIVDMLSFLK